MKPLRIAYDVSFPASYHDREDKITGIGRVIENVVQELLAFGEVDLHLTGCYGGDPRPAYTSAKARSYWEKAWKPEGCPFLESVTSSTGFFPTLRRPLIAANAWKDEGLFLPLQIVRKGLNAFTRWDTHPRLNSGAFDLFHATFNPPPTEFIPRTRPQVLNIYDLIPLEDPPESLNYQMLRETLRRIEPISTWVICTSEYIKQELLRFTEIAEDRVMIAPLAAGTKFRPQRDPNDLATVRQTHALPSGPYLLAVSNPQPRKNLPFLIRCFQQLAQASPDLQLVIAGSKKLGWGHDSIDAQLNAFPDLRSRIHFVGQVTDEDLSVLYSHCLAFVFPSLSEGFGLPPLEAMQCGAPVICSPLTSLPEVVGDSALLVDPHDERSLIEAVRLLQQDENKRASMSEMSLRRAAMFSWRNTAECVLETYRAAAQSLSP